MSKTTSAPPISGPMPNLIEFLESVPPPVTLLLVELAPAISRLRWAAEVVSWKSHWAEPWLALAAWWAICLSTNAVLKYLLPLTLLLPASLPYLPSQRTATPRAPTTEHSITLSLSDITTLRTLLPTLPEVPPLPFATALRASALLYIPYIVITFFVPMPILLGVTGTVFITYRAPWARTLRAVLGRSAYVQRSLLRLWYLLSGSTSPALGSLDTHAHSLSLSKSLLADPSAPAPASPPIWFLFTILECQRWWMGLDWTAALLPGERPSWCGLSHQPVSPPSAFSLPPPTTVFLAAPRNKRIKRTATWRWEESEWGILVNKDGKGSGRIEKKPPGLEDEEGGGSRIATRAASILKERTASIGSISEVTSGKDDRDSGTNSSAGTGVESERGEELATDAEGWVYGDNKWESTSAKGGMGKYTRFRRWTRMAVLEETVEEAGPGELGILQDTNTSANEEPDRETTQSDEETKGTKKVSSSPQKELDRPDSRAGQQMSPKLRERLKTAVKDVKI